MRHLFRVSGLVALGALLSACQSQHQSAHQHQSPQEGAYVDFVMGVMVESAKLSEGPDDAQPAIQAVESWRGADEDEGDG